MSTNKNQQNQEELNVDVIETDVVEETSIITEPSNIEDLYDVNKTMASILTNIDTENRQINKKVTVIGRAIVEQKQAYTEIEQSAIEHKETLEKLNQQVETHNTDVATGIDSITREIKDLNTSTQKESKKLKPVVTQIKEYLAESDTHHEQLTEQLKSQSADYTNQIDSFKESLSAISSLVTDNVLHDDIQKVKENTNDIKTFINRQNETLQNNHEVTCNKLDNLLESMTTILTNVTRHESALEKASATVQNIDIKVDELDQKIDKARLTLDVNVPETLEELFAPSKDIPTKADKQPVINEVIDEVKRTEDLEITVVDPKNEKLPTKEVPKETKPKKKGVWGRMFK